MNIKIVTLCIVFATALSACTKQTPLEKMFSEANKVKVFINYGGTVPEIHYETNDQDKMRGFARYFDEKADANGNCPYEGKIIVCFTDTDSTTLKFSLARGCTQATYKTGSADVTKLLSPEGIKFFTDLSNIH